MAGMCKKLWPRAKVNSFYCWLCGLLLLFLPSIGSSDTTGMRLSGGFMLAPYVGLGHSLMYHPVMPYLTWPGVIYPDVYWLFPCYPYASCITQYQQQRSRRSRQWQQAESVFGQKAFDGERAMEVWRASQRPSAQQFQTDERQIVPAFRGHSQIRSEFDQVGKFLPPLNDSSQNMPATATVPR